MSMTIDDDPENEIIHINDENVSSEEDFKVINISTYKPEISFV